MENNIKRKVFGFTVKCGADEEFCDGYDADRWCIKDGKVCSHLIFGLKKKLPEDIKKEA